jgi:hypothetical protein
MNKRILFLCIFFATCNAAEKVTLVNFYSSMTSKRQKHEITLSNGVFITLVSSLVDQGDIKVTVSQGIIPTRDDAKSPTVRRTSPNPSVSPVRKAARTDSQRSQSLS